MALAGSAFILAFYLFLISRLSPFGALGSYLQTDEAQMSLMRQTQKRKSLEALATQLQSHPSFQVV